MTIKYAILGVLSRNPQTGYDLKRILFDSQAFCCSDDGNLIYKTIIQLLKEGLVVNEAKKQADLPTKKTWFITESGLSELKKWVVSTPEPPQIINSFFVRLASADLLEGSELNELLERYENEIRMQILIQQEKARRVNRDIKSAKCSTNFWNAITERVMSIYENELQWIGELKGVHGKSINGGNLI